MSKQPTTHSVDSPENLLPYAQELVNSSIQGVLAFDIEWRYTVWNPAMERISGYSAKEVLGKRAFEVFPFLKQTGHDRYFYETLAGKSLVSPATPYHTAKGREGYFESRYFPVRNEAGEVTGGFALILDVTERKKAEEALKISETTLRTLFNSRAYNILLIGKDGKLLAFNEGAAKAAREVQGVEYKVGENFLSYIPEKARGAVEERHSRILAGESLRLEQPYKGVDGVEHWYDIQYDPVRDEKGEITGICLANVCIDDQKKAKEALVDSEATLRAVFNSGPQAMVLLGLDARVKAFNRNAALDAEKNRGYSYEIGHSMVDYVGEKAAAGFQERFQKALKGETIRIERPLPNRDGSENWVELTYNPVFDGNGKVTGVCMTALSIEDRRRAEEDLRRSEADLRAVFNSGSQVTVLIGGDGRIKGYNKSAEKMAPLVLGKKLKLGMLFTETFPPGASLEVFQKSFMAAIEGKETRGERPIRSADGQERWVEVSYQGVFNHEGGVDGVCFSLTFIDERKKAEEALRRSEMDLRAVFNSGSQLTILIGRDGRVQAFNQAAADVALQTMNMRQEVGRLLTDYIPTQNLADFRQCFAATLGGNTVKGERSFIGVDGREHWMEMGYYPVFNERNEVEGVCFTTVFIDERKRAENALRESEERYRRLVESSPESLLVHSEGKIAYMNPAGVKLLGATGLDQLTGKPILDIIHPDYRELVLARVRRLDTEGKQNEPLEQKFIGLDGRVIDVEVTGIPFLYQGKAAGLAIIRDITDHKKTQGMLLRYERLAAIGKVIAAIAHEIRNPLSMLTGMSQILKSKMESRKEFSQEIATILAQTERLRLFVNDILDYSREMEMKKKEIDARLLMEQSLTAVQAQMGPAHLKIEVKWEWDKTLPFLWGDGDRLEQVMVNLIMNAFQSMRDEGTLTLLGRVRKGFVLLGVKDNGPGVSEPDLPRLFEPFFTTKKQGSGLGLSISQKIAEAHGGKIEVQRIQPHGTLFTLQLPLSKT